MGSQQQQRQRRWSKVRLGHKRSQMALQQGWEEGWLDRAVTVDAQRLTLYVSRLVCVLWSPLRGRVHTVRAEQSCDLKLSSLCSHSALLKGCFHWSSYREMIKRKKSRRYQSTFAPRSGVQQNCQQQCISWEFEPFSIPSVFPHPQTNMWVHTWVIGRDPDWTSGFWGWCRWTFSWTRFSKICLGRTVFCCCFAADCLNSCCVIFPRLTFPPLIVDFTQTQNSVKINCRYRLTIMTKEHTKTWKMCKIAGRIHF